MVEVESSILHIKTLKERLSSKLDEVNEEIDQWFYLLEDKYKRWMFDMESRN